MGANKKQQKRAATVSTPTSALLASVGAEDDVQLALASELEQMSASWCASVAVAHLKRPLRSLSLAVSKSFPHDYHA